MDWTDLIRFAVLSALACTFFGVLILLVQARRDHHRLDHLTAVLRATREEIADIRKRIDQPLSLRVEMEPEAQFYTVAQVHALLDDVREERRPC